MNQKAAADSAAAFLADALRGFGRAAGRIGYAGVVQW